MAFNPMWIMAALQGLNFLRGMIGSDEEDELRSMETITQEPTSFEWPGLGALMTMLAKGGIGRYEQLAGAGMPPGTGGNVFGDWSQQFMQALEANWPKILEGLYTGGEEETEDKERTMEVLRKKSLGRV